MEFFRHCPACGRRFHIKLESKKLVRIDREPVPGLLTPRTTIAPFQAPFLLVHEGAPVTADIEEFQYMYKCNHCGHEWAEKHIEEHKES